MTIAGDGNARDQRASQTSRVGSKEFVQQGHSHFCARSVLVIREHGKMAICLREAASAGMEPLACQP